MTPSFLLLFALAGPARLPAPPLADVASDIEGEHRCAYGAVADPSLPLPGEAGVPDPATPEACRARREALAAEVGQGLLLFGAGPSGDGRFDPDEDFHYLTGVRRPGARLLLEVRDGSLVRDVLYLPRQSERQRLWEGPEAGPEDFGEEARFDEVLGLEVFDLAALAEGAAGTGVHAVDEATIEELVEHGVEVLKARTALNELQKVKSPAEQRAVEAAVRITLAGLAEAMVVARPGTYEYTAEAAVEGGFRRRGAEFLAFPSICGSGPNGCFLHYRANNRPLADGELLLVDVGAKVHGYCADVTRTFPVNGRFTTRQREVYGLVFEAQTLAAEQLRPGVTMRELHEAVVAFFDEKGQRGNFKHGLGHQLGIRVHDVPGFRGTLEPGMIVTIEPGLYLAEEDLGVRIEDDYLVTQDGSRKLSAALPSQPDELEAYIARLRGE